MILLRYDKYSDIHPVKLETEDEGWWCKFQLYKPGVLSDGEYLYLDLDVVIVDNIDCFFEHPSFGITRDFIRPDQGLLPGKEYNSSVVRFNNTTTGGLYQYYSDNKEYWLSCQQTIAPFFGDQNVTSSYINYYPEFCTPFPDKWCWSYKKGWERGKTAGDRSQMFGRKIHEDGKICIFHGNPSPDVLLRDKKCPQWVKDNWK